MAIRSRPLPPKLVERAFLIPALITVTGLFAGFLSIISSIKFSYDHSIKWIALAFILDGLDGRVARKLNAASPFGREFDSLCDLVAFGVAPAILVWNWAFRTEFDEFGVLASFLFVAAGATRLARFNITTTAEPKSYFQGLPIPGAAACLATLVYAFPDSSPSTFFAPIIIGYTVFLAIMMVSTFKFESFKRFSLKGLDPRLVLLGLSLGVALVWKFNRVSLFIILFLYAVSGPLLFLFKKDLGARE